MDTSYLPALLGIATLLPLLSFFVILTIGPRMGRFSAGLSIAAIGMAGVLSFWSLVAIWIPHHWPEGVHHAAHGHDDSSHGDSEHHGAGEHDSSGHGDDEHAEHHGDDSHDHDHGEHAGHPHDDTPADSADGESEQNAGGETPADSSEENASESDANSEHSGEGQSGEEHSSGEHSDEGQTGAVAGGNEHGADSQAGDAGSGTAGAATTGAAVDASGPPYAGEYYLLGQFGRLRITIGYYIDALTLCMFCMVTLIATCIHIYAVGYMHEELEDVTDHEVTLSDGSHPTRPGRFPRFFQYLSLFCFSMLGLVLAGNIAMVFVFWELVGICSYFLIGFYIERKSASNAANKAFIVNRVGDFGMIIGLMILWTTLGTFAFADSETELFRTEDAFSDSLDDGVIPPELRREVAARTAPIARFAAVQKTAHGSGWKVSEFDANRTLFLIPDEGQIRVVEHIAGIFSQVRPEDSPAGDRPHALIVPDGMVLAGAQTEIARIFADHPSEDAAADRWESDQASISEVSARISTWRKEGLGYGLLILAGLGIFCGCVGKSAQFPLHVWLPDAMEGPTPVSALVHSATMVAAGVYLVGRFYPVFAPEVLLTIACIGTITLFMAATIAITATDIKRVLAYSTVSQLGYMMMALGVGGWVAGLMHLITHAFFKSLLFLCSGSVIHAVHTNEMPQMGGLLKKMPITAILMLIGCLAIIGASVPFIVGMSGYYSKDAILEQALSLAVTNVAAQKWAPLFFVMGAGGAAVTAFYMFRMWFMTFLGQPRDAHRFDHAHESPAVMWVPLFVLSVFAISIAWTPSDGTIGSLICLLIFGWLLVRTRAAADADRHGPVTSTLTAAVVVSAAVLLMSLIWRTTPLGEVVLANLLEDARPAGTAPFDAAGHSLPAAQGELLTWPNEHDSHVAAIKTPATLIAFFTAIAGVGLASALYWFRWIDPGDVRHQFNSVYRFLLNKWWFDELYDWMFVRPTHAVSRLTAGIDKRIIDWLVDSTASCTATFARIWEKVADQTIVDGFVDLFASWTYGIGLKLREVQRGKLREYVMFIVLGTIVIFVVISFF